MCVNAYRILIWAPNIAKMAFAELREGPPRAIQGAVVVSPAGFPVSKQMVKWAGGLLRDPVC